MQIRFGRIGSVVALSAALSLGIAHTPAQAAPPDNALLGVRLMSTYRDVLHKLGQPHEIQEGAPVTPAAPNTPGQPGARGPGMPGMGYPGMAPGMPGAGFRPPGAGMGGRGIGAPSGPPPGMMGGYPGMMGRGPGMSGPPPGVFQGYGYPGMAGRPGGLPGFSGAGRPGGLPGMSGGLPGFAGAPGLPSLGAGAAENAQPEEAQKETTWWYRYPQKGLYYSVLFNKDGRVIQIQEFGWKGGGKTRRGIGLGSSLGQIIAKYGWSTNGTPSGEDLMLRYGGRDQVMFQLHDNKVVGITVAAVK